MTSSLVTFLMNWAPHWRIWEGERHKESPFGRKGQSQQSAQASPWGCAGSKEAWPKALALRTLTMAWLKDLFVCCSDFYQEFTTQGPPSPSSGNSGCSSHIRGLCSPSYPLFTLRKDSSHHTMGSLREGASGTRDRTAREKDGQEGPILCQGESEWRG